LPLSAKAQAAAEAPVLRLQLLNGRTGRPVAHQRLMLLAKDGKPFDGVGKEGVTTDGEGYAPIPNVDATIVPDVLVAVEQHRPCSKAGKHVFSLIGVRARGVVSENSCKPRITMFPVAGTLVYFVRDETFLERMTR
jgi:hypothetical protein